MATAASGGLTLFIQGHESSTRNFGLYLEADAIPVESSSFPLVIFGANGSGMFGGIPLHTYAGTGANEPTGLIPLTLLGDSTDDAIRNFNLWTGGCAYDASAGCDLVVYNTQSGTFEVIPLIVSGDGGAEGWSPSEGNMNLVLVRDPAAAITLYTQGPGTASQTGVELVIAGGLTASGDLTLSVPGAIGFATKNAKLFTHGW